MLKAKGMKMQGLGKHYSTTYEKPITGHSLVQCLYTVVGRYCPLEPLVYQQEKTAEKEGENQEEYPCQLATLGQAHKEVQKTHQKLFLEWVYQQAFSGTPVDNLFASLVA